MVHWERNILSKVPAKERKELSKYIKQVYASLHRKMAFDIAQLIATKYQDKYPRVARFLEEDLESILTFFDHPDIHQRKIRTTNLIEGVLNKALKQRSKVIFDIPQRESCLRYACCILMEIDEEWQARRKYIKMLEEDRESDIDLPVRVPVCRAGTGRRTQTGDDLIKEITKVKQEVNSKEGLVAC